MVLGRGKTWDVGLDLGATLVKAVLVPEGRSVASYETFVCAARDTALLDAFLRSIRTGLVAATGGGSYRLAEAPIPPSLVNEFEAWGVGERLLLQTAGFVPTDPHLLVSLGTGTSILRVDAPGRVTRVGGTALGGGTLRGLGRLLLGDGDHEMLAALARQGDRTRVDLTVGDVYPTGQIALPADLTAANFGKGQSRSPGDLAAAVVGLVGENVALLAGAHAAILRAASPTFRRSRGQATVDVLYAGSTLRGQDVLRQVLADVTAMTGARARFLPGGEFAGALGALEMTRRGVPAPAPPASPR